MMSVFIRRVERGGGKWWYLYHNLSWGDAGSSFVTLGDTGPGRVDVICVAI